MFKVKIKFIFKCLCICNVNLRVFVKLFFKTIDEVRQKKLDLDIELTTHKATIKRLEEQCSTLRQDKIDLVICPIYNIGTGHCMLLSDMLNLDCPSQIRLSVGLHPCITWDLIT